MNGNATSMALSKPPLGMFFLAKTGEHGVQNAAKKKAEEREGITHSSLSRRMPLISEATVCQNPMIQEGKNSASVVPVVMNGSVCQLVC